MTIYMLLSRRRVANVELQYEVIRKNIIQIGEYIMM